MNKTYKNDKFISFISILLVFALSAAVVADYGIKTHKIQNQCLRLHVIASSDSDADQEVKLKVRDAILKEGGEIFGGETDAASALKKSEPFIPGLKAAADKVLRDNGFDYESEISVVNEYFDTRTYEDITLPAGRYTAFKVILGEGKGHNWWCVMFPPLCLPAVTADKDDSLYAVFGKEGTEIVKGKKEYKVRFRIVELIEEFLNKKYSD